MPKDEGQCGDGYVYGDTPPDLPRFTDDDPPRATPSSTTPRKTIASWPKPRPRRRREPAKGQSSCVNCGRATRPKNTRAADYPGTVNPGAHGLCQLCYRRGLYRGTFR